MADNVHIMPNTDVDPEVILSKAREWGLKEVLVLGWDEDDNLVLGGSTVELRDIVWLLRAADNWVSRSMQGVE